MPARTAEHHIGVLLKSDGAPLTEADRRGNDKVDALAKTAADGQRFLRHVRERIRIQAEDVAAMATWLAMATVQANAFHLEDDRVIRDSTASCPPRRMGLKRKLEPVLTQAERIFKSPRMVALRDRIKARGA